LERKHERDVRIHKMQIKQLKRELKHAKADPKNTEPIIPSYRSASAKNRTSRSASNVTQRVPHSATGTTRNKSKNQREGGARVNDKSEGQGRKSRSILNRGRN
jgi:hypothetical protein